MDRAQDARVKELIEQGRGVRMTTSDREAQRRSFAYGNTQIENPRISRASIDNAAEAMAKQDGTTHCGSGGCCGS